VDGSSIGKPYAADFTRVIHNGAGKFICIFPSPTGKINSKEVELHRITEAVEISSTNKNTTSSSDS
jgi:hypothetical protein